MSEMHTPALWREGTARQEGDRTTIAWPAPPTGTYTDSSQPGDQQPCLLIGKNKARVSGALVRITAIGIEMQSPPSRAVLQLPHEGYHSIALTLPLVPNPPSSAAQIATSAYRVSLADGGRSTGVTAGHVETAQGLFLFPTEAESLGAPPSEVHRLFLPKNSYTAFEVSESGPDSSPTDLMDLVADKPDSDQNNSTILSTALVRTPEQLFKAIKRQGNMPVVRVGEALQSLGLISQSQLSAALAQQATKPGLPLGKILCLMGFVSEDDLRVALAHKMGFPLVQLDEFPIQPEALKRLPHFAATRLRMVPVMMVDGRLVVALDDPAGRHKDVEEAEVVAKVKIIPVLAQCDSIETALWSAYDRAGMASGIKPLRLVPTDTKTDDNTTELLDSLERSGFAQAGPGEPEPDLQSDNALVRLVNSIIISALKAGASDIHVESKPAPVKTKVRFRVDGRMRTHLELTSAYRQALVARLKIMSSLDIADRRRPQDGKITFSKFSPEHAVELRVAVVPTNGGLEDVVMRVLASAKPLPLAKLGLSAMNAKAFTEAIERPYGLVLCVGPTGSGKTTTLHSALGHINTPERKVWTAEDPIEITQEGLRQVQINPKADLTFASALRAFLRADPDAIMVGEIRDKETAHMVIEASLTGHLVMSTLHTNSAPETVMRLLDMGLDPFNFADSLLAVLAQRLLRTLCKDCRTSRLATRAEVDELISDYVASFGKLAKKPSRTKVVTHWADRYGQDGQLMRYSCAGCKTCDGTGYKGRAGLHELMMIGPEMRHLIQTSATASQIQGAALDAGMRTLRQDGIDKVWAGITSIEEVRANTTATAN